MSPERPDAPGRACGLFPKRVPRDRSASCRFQRTRAHFCSVITRQPRRRAIRASETKARITKRDKILPPRNVGPVAGLTVVSLMRSRGFFHLSCIDVWSMHRALISRNNRLSPECLANRDTRRRN